LGRARSGLKLANSAVDNIDIWIRLQEGNLFFNFIGRQKVIPVQELDELARRQSTAGVPRPTLADIRLPRIPDSVTENPLDLSAGGIRGEIVNDDDFDRLI
jgi:hypothetical protein